MNKKVIDKYIHRKLQDWDWIKDTTKDEVLQEIYEYKDFNFKIEPYLHQLQCILLGIINPQFNFFLDMGLGKTYIILMLIEYWRRKALVLVPNEVNVYSWKKEIEKFTYFRAVGVSGSSPKKIELLQSDGDIYISNYMGFLRCFTKKKGKKNVINTDMVDSVLRKFPIVVFDEIHKLGNMKAKITQLCDLIPSNIRYGLTGTPFGKSPEKLWSEFKVVDNGATLGVSEYVFKNAYFTKSLNYWGGLDYHFKATLSDNLHQRIKNKSILYDTEECVDLPTFTHQEIEIPLNKQGRHYYNQSYDDLVDSLKEGEKAIDNSFVRLRAICAGYLYYRDEDNKKAKSEFTSNPKLDYLIEMLDDIDEKILVFNEYTVTGDIIEARLKKEKISCHRLYGATKNKQKVVKDFEEDDTKVLILNSQTGGTGTNLQFCRYAIFYETHVSPDVKKQCIKRIYRIGQEHHTFVYDLVMRNTLEESILMSIEKGENLYKSIIKGRKLPNGV